MRKKLVGKSTLLPLGSGLYEVETITNSKKKEFEKNFLLEKSTSAPVGNGVWAAAETMVQCWRKKRVLERPSELPTAPTYTNLLK